MAAATFALAAALPALAASRIVPALPTAFEPVNLRMTVDSWGLWATTRGWCWMAF